ncbi:50S ribosomal protein L22 [Salinarchaeum sp. IM2453]|uniref:50S ribosomal protein L22 n=1 Tax=Salinarchaeum sp. IM2453 TaxID=2862870 RepID=UPI001C839ACB|nr:50S ribosomal protein L22 [Salinarchaeum sp. IM2453]QZA87499.1 50S ribosomal protein L22 [Salinarchaeum sp. IM2453]
MGINYSVETDPEVNAKAMLRERHISPKHSKAIARAIKGMTAGEAYEYLEDVIAGEQSVPFKEHNSGVGHRSDIDGWDAGRYPEKASEAFLDLLKNGIANADHRGFDGESMIVSHVAAHKVGEIQGRKPRAMGRASDWNTPEVDVELVLEEQEDDSEEGGEE